MIQQKKLKSTNGKYNSGVSLSFVAGAEAFKILKI